MLFVSHLLFFRILSFFPFRYTRVLRAWRAEHRWMANVGALKRVVDSYKRRAGLDVS